MKTGAAPSEAHQENDAEDVPHDYIERTAAQVVLSSADVQPSGVPLFNTGVTQDHGGVHIPRGNRSKKEQPCKEKQGRLQRMVLDTLDHTIDEYVDYFYKPHPFMGDMHNVHHIFVPVNDDNIHLYLLVIDVPIKKAYVVDSLPSIDTTQCEAMAQKIVSNDS
ncbi:hypothetical protein J5N97_025913 [Dioscorea zingiberensis]|uniref:Ubiquitin-like protease family profile domain-containing protein n=1 Tax=Dioscorea zingiberensis TaxID=325984 RepID=A0A9D5C1F9_9LILI|nr:hypothetical protein J5N97_025913 [Dioscorea zingiberensis]